MKPPWYVTVTEWHEHDGVAWVSLKVSRWVMPYLYAREALRMAWNAIRGS